MSVTLVSHETGQINIALSFFQHTQQNIYIDKVISVIGSRRKAMDVTDSEWSAVALFSSFNHPVTTYLRVEISGWLIGQAVTQFYSSEQLHSLQAAG